MNDPLAGELYAVLMHLRNGGSLVPLVGLTDDEIIIARHRGWLYLDRDGHGFVYRPPRCAASSEVVASTHEPLAESPER